MDSTSFLQGLQKSWNESAKYPTIQDILTGDKVRAIGYLAKYDEVPFYQFMSKVFSDNLAFWAVGRSSFSGESGAMQAIEIIRLVIKNYGWLKISDIRLCFEYAKRGEYGEVYNRIDGAVIMSWFKRYAEERMQVALAVRDRMHEEAKKMNVDTSDIDREGLKKLAAMFGKLAPKQDQQEAREFKSIQEYCEYEGLDYHRYMSDWRSQFDHLLESEAQQLGVTADQLFETKVKLKLIQINRGYENLNH